VYLICALKKSHLFQKWLEANKIKGAGRHH